MSCLNCYDCSREIDTEEDECEFIKPDNASEQQEEVCICYECADQRAQDLDYGEWAAGRTEWELDNDREAEEADEGYEKHGED